MIHQVITVSPSCVLQEVKDKYCTRVIEKLRNQLNGDRCSKSASNQDTTLLNLDDNTGGTSKQANHSVTRFRNVSWLRGKKMSP